jgi:DNA-binding LacI/PurR family transcriptional regulator
MEDVARLAGVSRGTVSRAINGAPDVDPDLVAAVNDAVDKLGYTVNITARNLAKGRTGFVAFIISERPDHLFQDPNFGVYVDVFSRHLRLVGRHLLITMAEDTAEEALVADYLTAGHVDGVLVALPHGQNNLLQRLLAKGIPTVVLGKPLKYHRDSSWVAIDNKKAAHEVVGYLMRRHRMPIATVTGPLQTSSGRDRLAGYRNALGTDFRPDLVVEGDWSVASGRTATEELLERCPDLGALFVASDLMAMGALVALRRAGRRVPEDVAVAAFDDSAAATMADPLLTTMHNPFEQTAVEALRILDDLMNRRADGPVHVVLPTDLVVRDSA